MDNIYVGQTQTRDSGYALVHIRLAGRDWSYLPTAWSRFLNLHGGAGGMQLHIFPKRGSYTMQGVSSKVEPVSRYEIMAFPKNQGG